MEDVSKAIMCGTCNCPAESTPNPKPEDQVACPTCGQVDRFDEARRIMFEHIEYGLICARHKGFLDTFGKPASDAADVARKYGPNPFFKWQVRS
jgi:hypothetical protein